jgi:hypothetical protein
MDISVFSRVFSYRQREHHSPLENFLTEIFAFCIETDLNFRYDFLKLVVSNYSNQLITISTQELYEDLGKPDIEICFDDTCIFIESKIEASERPNQLDDYAAILVKKKKYADKNIVFLTKYFESKELSFATVRFKLIRWYDIYELINEDNSEITKQLKLFLKEKNMENVKNFSIQDILAMKTIPETINKMEELLEQLRPQFEKYFGTFSRERGLDYYYDGYSTFKYQSHTYYLAVGFTWWPEDNEIPLFGLWFNIKKKFENSDLVDILQKELIKNNEWDIDEDDLSPYIMKPISDFIDKEEDCIPAMKKFIEKHLKTLLEVKKKYPKLLQK